MLRKDVVFVWPHCFGLISCGATDRSTKCVTLKHNLEPHAPLMCTLIHVSYRSGLWFTTTAIA